MPLIFLLKQVCENSTTQAPCSILFYHLLPHSTQNLHHDPGGILQGILQGQSAYRYYGDWAQLWEGQSGLIAGKIHSISVSLQFMSTAEKETEVKIPPLSKLEGISRHCSFSRCSSRNRTGSILWCLVPLQYLTQGVFL